MMFYQKNLPRKRKVLKVTVSSLIVKNNVIFDNKAFCETRKLPYAVFSLKMIGLKFIVVLKVKN